MQATTRHNAQVHGAPDGPPMLFAHGFGCDQNMWRHVWPAFAGEHRIVLFDHVGHGGSDRGAFDPDRYASLDGYAADVLDICHELDLRDVIFVGHSVSAMIGALAANAEPERFARLVMVGPSPRYLDDDGYVGGFSREDIDELLASLESNYLGWSSVMAPVSPGNEARAARGNEEPPELGAELAASFCATAPAIARLSARVTPLADNRDYVPHVRTRALV